MTFDFYLGGYGRDEFRLKLVGSLLHCSEYQGIPLEDDMLISLIDNKDWDELVNLLRTSTWKKRYDNIHICDGTQWELKAKVDGIKITSYGSNSYPEQFDEFLIILNRVMAGVGLIISK